MTTTKGKRHHVLARSVPEIFAIANSLDGLKMHFPVFLAAKLDLQNSYVLLENKIIFEKIYVYSRFMIRLLEWKNIQHPGHSEPK